MYVISKAKKVMGLMRGGRALLPLLALASVAIVACSDDSGVGHEGGTNPPREVMAKSAQTLGVSENVSSVEDAPRKGPGGFFRTPDGFAVTDNHQKKVLFLDEEFNVTGSLDFEGKAMGAAGVDVNGGDVVILDAFAPEPAIISFRGGEVLSRREVHSGSETPPTGLQRDDAGLLVVYENGTVAQRVNPDGSLTGMSRAEFMFGGTAYSLQDMDPEDPTVRTLNVGGRKTALTTPNFLGTAQIIGGDAGGIDVLVEDVTFGQPIMVAQTVLRVSSDGVIESAAPVPGHSADSVYVPHSVVVMPNGNAFTLTADVDAVRVWESAPGNPASVDLGAMRTGDSRDGERSHEIGDTTQALTTYPGCLSQSTMASNANEYVNNSRYLSPTNISNPSPCDTGSHTRWQPSYLGSAGTYSSVSYDWGGWNTPSQFNTEMANGGKAGDTNDTFSSGLWCTYGTDCSGFTARVWGHTEPESKPNTTMLTYSSYSSAAYGPGYYKGDAFVWSGHHVCVYEKTGGNGFYLWEAVGNPYDRVVYRTTTWSYVSGWSARHSNHHCNY